MTLAFKTGDNALRMSKRRSRGMILPRIVISGPGSIEDIPIVISELSLPESGLIICDEITYDIAGKRVKKYIEECMQEIYNILVICVGEPPKEVKWKYYSNRMIPIN